MYVRCTLTCVQIKLLTMVTELALELFMICDLFSHLTAGLAYTTAIIYVECLPSGLYKWLHSPRLICITHMYLTQLTLISQGCTALP